MDSSNSSQHNSGWVIQIAGEQNTITLNLLNIEDFSCYSSTEEKVLLRHRY